MNIRVIPRLDIKGSSLVKGVHLEGLRVLGTPEWFARRYYEEGADELIYMDVVASLYGRNSLLPIIERTAKEIFIPLTVGGGLRTIEDIRTVLCSGADKVSLNTAAIRNSSIVKEAAQRFGSSTIVVSIEAKKQPDGHYEAYTDNGRERTGFNVFKWALRVVELGAGEIFLTSIDREGTGRGFDLELVQQVAQAVPIPVIACGGAGIPDHVVDVIKYGRADAVALASMLHYKYKSLVAHKDGADGASSLEGNIEFLKSGRQFSAVEGTTLTEIKERLVQNDISCRFVSCASRAVHDQI